MTGFDFDTPIDRAGHAAATSGTSTRPARSTCGSPTWTSPRRRRSWRRSRPGPCTASSATRAARVAGRGGRRPPRGALRLARRAGAGSCGCPSVVRRPQPVLRAFAGPGETVMTVSPIYPPFLKAPPRSRRGGCLDRAGDAGDGGRWRLPLDEMEAAVTPDTRAAPLLPPAQPGGAGLAHATRWRRSSTFCRRHDLVLCSDEIHCDLLLDPVEHVPAALVDPGRAAALGHPDVPEQDVQPAGLQLRLRRGRPTRRCGGAFRAPGRGLVSPNPRRVRRRRRRGRVPRGRAVARRAARLPARQPGPASSASSPRELPGASVAHVEATYLAWLDVRGCDAGAIPWPPVWPRAWPSATGSTSGRPGSCA